MIKQLGLTLIELLVTVAILAILMTIALPSFQDFFASNRVATSTSDFVTALNLARSEAIRRGETVSVIKNGGASKNWDGGWTIFLDSNSDGIADAGEVLRAGAAMPTNVTMRSNNAALDLFGFSPSGRIVGGGNGSFFLCHNSDEVGGRAVVLTAIGRVRVEDIAVGGTCEP